MYLLEIKKKLKT